MGLSCWEVKALFVPFRYLYPSPIAQGGTSTGNCRSSGGTFPCLSSPSCPGDVPHLQERFLSFTRSFPAPGSPEEAFGSWKREKLPQDSCSSWLSKEGKVGAMKMVKLEMEMMSGFNFQPLATLTLWRKGIERSMENNSERLVGSGGKQ